MGEDRFLFMVELEGLGIQLAPYSACPSWLATVLILIGLYPGILVIKCIQYGLVVADTHVLSNP